MSGLDVLIGVVGVLVTVVVGVAMVLLVPRGTVEAPPAEAGSRPRADAAADGAGRAAVR